MTAAIGTPPQCDLAEGYATGGACAAGVREAPIVERSCELMGWVFRWVDLLAEAGLDGLRDSERS